MSNDVKDSVMRYHCVLVKPKDILAIGGFAELEYIILTVFKTPINRQAIDHYNKHGHMLAYMDGRILRIEKPPRYAPFGDHAVIPVKIESQHFNSVSMARVKEWQSEIEQQENKLQKYKNTTLPLQDKWIGVIDEGNRQDVMLNILRKTGEDKLLHDYELENKELFDPDIKGKISSGFYTRGCLDIDCGYEQCQSFVKRSELSASEQINVKKALDKYSQSRRLLQQLQLQQEMQSSKNEDDD